MNSKEYSWFNIEHYNICREFTRDDWVNVLSPRICANNELDYYITNIENNTVPDEQKIEARIEAHQFIVPLLFRNKPYLMKISDDIQYMRGYNKGRPMAINALQADHFLELYNQLSSGGNVDLINKNDRIYLPLALERLVYNNFIPENDLNYILKDTQTEKGNRIKLTYINLNYSDDKLIKDFAKWLQNQRKQLPNRIAPEKRISTKKLNKCYTNKNLEYLCKHKVLPYMDLFIFNKLNDKKITQDQYLDLLGLVDIDTMKKFTIPKAKAIFKEGISLITS